MNEFDFNVTRDGAIARIDLNRPDEGNALTRAMMVRLAQVLRELGRDNDVHVVAIGSRGRQFCRAARQASGRSRHHAIVCGWLAAPSSVSRFAVNVPTSVLFARYAAEAKLSMEYGPGIGPSVSTSVLT
mgnify:CR=1 FL=1